MAAHYEGEVVGEMLLTVIPHVASALSEEFNTTLEAPLFREQGEFQWESPGSSSCIIIPIGQEIDGVTFTKRRGGRQGLCT